ncbi:hypothetical protein AB6A40_011201 [Gnathostoma spinigerum]|uniref:Peroxisomal ATPase PEX1 N-terminal C-lobe domain-containing protein n=1 Tax=Gnathostoma spinigerum TaxID=75299 RepID=A0ABD6EZD3_9BILA
MSTCEFPVRLGNHNWCNCFGYLIATDSEEILQCLTQPSNWNSLGFFVINRNTPPHKIAIELFEQPDLPSPGLNVYHTLLLNPTFADLCGLSDDEAIFDAIKRVISNRIKYRLQAVVSRVNDVPRGCFIELTTRRLADWALMDSVSAEVGNVFLTQIHLVSDGMRFPIWLGQNIVCSFAVGVFLSFVMFRL